MNAHRIRVSAALAALLAFTFPTARASQATATDDSYSSQAKPATPLGTLPQVLVDSADHGFFKFDLSPLPAGTTAAQVSKVTLTLWVNRVTVAGSFDVSQVTGAWDEGTLTWNIEPATAAALAQPVSIAVANTFVRVDVTGIVQSWLNGSPNQGIRIAVNGATPTASVFFDSKESTGTSHPAYLDIVLSGPAGPQGPTGLTGATGATGAQGPAGPNTLALGSAAAPSLSFLSNSNTGMYSSGANTVDFATNGAKLLELRSDGDVDFLNALRHAGTRVLWVPESTSLGLGGGALAAAPSASSLLSVAVGASALAANSTGLENSALGASALLHNTDGSFNVAVGDNALRGNTLGETNTAVGSHSLASNTTGNSNTALGYSAGHGISTGSNNIVIGNQASPRLGTGSQNVAIGDFAGALASNQNFNIFLGYNAGAAVDGSNNIEIGNQGAGSDSGVIRLGDIHVHTSAYIAGVLGVTTGGSAVPVVIDGNGQLGTVSSSRRYKEDIHDMADASDALMRLRPVTYRYKQPRADGSKPLEFGLIAEEVDEVYPELVARNNTGQIETVQYYKLDAMLLNELQKQRRTIEALEARLATLEAK